MLECSHICVQVVVCPCVASELLCAFFCLWYYYSNSIDVLKTAYIEGKQHVRKFVKKKFLKQFILHIGFLTTLFQLQRLHSVRREVRLANTKGSGWRLH